MPFCAVACQKQTKNSTVASSFVRFILILMRVQCCELAVMVPRNSAQRGVSKSVSAQNKTRLSSCHAAIQAALQTTNVNMHTRTKNWLVSRVGRRSTAKLKPAIQRPTAEWCATTVSSTINSCIQSQERAFGPLLAVSASVSTTLYFLSILFQVVDEPYMVG